MFTDGIHPAIEVGNDPSYLLDDVFLRVLPINIHNWNMRERIKAIRALY